MTMLAVECDHGPIMVSTNGRPRHYIRERRKAKGREWTLEFTAAKADMTTSNLSQIERYKIGLTGDSMRDLALALGCSPAELFLPPGAKVEDDDSDLPDIFAELTPEARQQLTEIAKTFRR